MKTALLLLASCLVPASAGIFSGPPLLRGSETRLARDGRRLAAAGRYLQAEPFLEKRLALEKEKPRADPKPLSRAEIELGDLYAEEGRWSDAEDLYDSAYARLRPAFGVDDPEVAALADRMGELYRLQGRFLRAEQVLRQALDSRERILGADHPDVAGSIEHLGRLLRDEGRLRDAETLLERALALRTRGFIAARGAAAARVMADLASVYKAQDRLQDAEPLYRKAIAVQRRALGRRHPELAATLEQAAPVLRRRGEPSDAEAFETEAAAIRALNARDVPAIAVTDR